MSSATVTEKGAAPDRRRLVLWGPVAVWMAVILLLGGDAFSAERTGGWLRSILRVVAPLLEPSRFDMIHSILRKFAHVVEYAVLGALNARALSSGRRGRQTPATSLAAIGLAALWAMVDEGSQAFVAGRTASAGDVLFDAAGAGAGTLVRRCARRRITARPETAPAPPTGGPAPR